MTGSEDVMHLQHEIDQTRSLISSRGVFADQASIYLLILHARLLEIMLHGKPTTPLPKRHHE